MEQRLVLQDDSGKVLRAFNWSGEPLQVIRRADTQRLELVENLESFQNRKIPFQTLGELNSGALKQGPVLVGKLGHLTLVDSIESTLQDEASSKDDRKSWYLILGVLTGVFIALGVIVKNVPMVTAKLEEELRQQVVKIAKNISKPETVKPATNVNSDVKVSPTQKTVSLKRMGALSVLGSLKTGAQKGGLNLGQTQVTAGPGLGGTAGSGGVQTSIYAKGIVGAPLGAGGNIQGAGGYGTKGKGGGQAGYGNLSLVGSSGASPIPLGAEASVAKGLDKDQIAAVINRNLGQVRFCYEQGLQGDPHLNGRVAIAFVIGASGLVKTADIENTTLNAKAVEDCLVLRLKSWKFPLPEGGVDVKVSYPFVLRRSGQG